MSGRHVGAAGPLASFSVTKHGFRAAHPHLPRRRRSHRRALGAPRRPRPPAPARAAARGLSGARPPGGARLRRRGHGLLTALAEAGGPPAGRSASARWSSPSSPSSATGRARPARGPDRRARRGRAAADARRPHGRDRPVHPRRRPRLRAGHPARRWDVRTLLRQRVLVHGREDLEGVVGTTPVHCSRRRTAATCPTWPISPSTSASRRRVRELVRAGDVVTRVREVRRLGDLVTGKSLDDRVGVLVMIEALRAATARAGDRRGHGAGGRAARRARGGGPRAAHVALAIDVPGERRPRHPALGADDAAGPARSGSWTPAPSARRPLSSC